MKAVSYVAVGIVAFLAGAFSHRLVSRAEDAKAAQQAPASRTIAVEGMTCQGCVDTITEALTKVPGVRSVKVSLEDKTAVVVADESQVSTDAIVAAIDKAGYQAKPAAAGIAPASVDHSAKQPLLVNITHGKDDLHAVCMGLGLAQSALKDGRTAIVFLNVEAPVFAAKDLGEDVKFADFPPVKTMLADFLAAGGRVLVCGHCAHVVHLDTQNVIDGAKILAQGELFAALPPGSVVFSY